jgi:hypothetical protein
VHVVKCSNGHRFNDCADNPHFYATCGKPGLGLWLLLLCTKALCTGCKGA